ncbi:MAG TPA: M48 family metalloprotease, partial [Burkholderiaceae bacterium]|nr:M48 family metalloprotease [Burkholderiaceae bacterium]
ASDDFSIATEHQLGAEIMREIRADPDYLDDPVLLEYLQTLWQPLVAQARVRGNLTTDIDQRLAWEPFLVRDKEVNAFALPGGYVGVNLGLIAITNTRDELASVLAHEMSHITQRHIARSIGNARRQTLLSLAGMLAGLVVASKAGNSSIDAANAAVVGSQALAVQGQLNFSRDMEREADRVGWQVMTGAGFAPSGMATMFEKMDQSQRLNDFGGYPYLRSHPLTSERIGEARSRMGTAPPALPVSVLEHTAAQARARVMMDARFDALRRWQALDGDKLASTPGDKLLNAYSSALASTLLRDWARADASIAVAAALVRSNARAERDGSSGDARAERVGSSGDARAERAVALLDVQSKLARGDVAHAVSALAPYAAEPSRPVLLLATQATLASTPPSAPDNPAVKQRAEQLRTWVATNPNDSLAWTALGQVEERLGQPLRALRADAESRVALGDLTGAVDRLQAGQRRARSGGAVDFIDVSVIDARLRDVEGQIRQRKADEKSPR